MYKLIACDVDGTLLDSSFTAKQIDKDAILKVQEKGIIFALCSGRSYKSLKTIAKDLGVWEKGNHIVGFNGGIIYDMEKSRIVRQENLDKNAGVKTIEFFKQMPRNIEIVIYTDAEHVLYERHAKYAPVYQKTSECEWLDAEDILKATRNLNSIGKIIFLGENRDLKLFEQELAGTLGEETCTIFTAEYMLEVSPTSSTKGNGVKWLCQNYNIDISEVICIGDNYNDISMIKEAGLGVAVANAVNAAKEAADYITENDCRNGAVAEVITKFVLSGP